MATSDIDELQAELTRLRAENEALRGDADTLLVEPVPSAVKRSGAWRAVVSALVITIAAILVPVSIVGAWARVQLVDEDRFVSTFAPLADDPGVQALVVDQATGAIEDAIDIRQITNDLFDGIEALGLPPRASVALDLLRQPAADGVVNLVDGAVTRVVESDAFSAVWQRALLASHRSLVAVATGDGSGAVTLDDQGQIGIQIGPIIEEVKKVLVDRGFGFAEAIPVINRTVVVAQADALLVIGTVYNLAVTMGSWLPFLTLVLFAAGILIARRRTTAVLGTGVGIALGAGVLAAGLTGAGAVLALSAGNLMIPASTLDTIFFTVVGAMRDTAVVLCFLGIVVAVAAWLGGRWAPAAKVRALCGSLSSSARSSLQSRGLSTGRFGAWLQRQRVLVRVLILVSALLLLFSLRPLSVGDIVGTVVLALAVWLILELLHNDGSARLDDDDVTLVAPVSAVEVVDGEDPVTDAAPEPVAARAADV